MHSNVSIFKEMKINIDGFKALLLQDGKKKRAQNTILGGGVPTEVLSAGDRLCSVPTFCERFVIKSYTRLPIARLRLVVVSWLMRVVGLMVY